MATRPTQPSERQIAELALLASMYPNEYHQQSVQPHHHVEQATAKCTLHLQPSYTLELSLPPGYPDSTAPIAYLQCGGEVSTVDRKVAREKLSNLVECVWREQKGEGECLDILVEAFGAWLDEFRSTATSALSSTSTSSRDAPNLKIQDSLPTSSRTAEEEEDSHAAHRPLEEEENLPVLKEQPAGPRPYPGSSAQQQQQQIIKRTLLWSHHLLATSKRKAILTWSRELCLGGYSRPGYPGAIFVEGEIANVDEFVRRMKALKWQALQVRAEEVVRGGNGNGSSGGTKRGRICGDGSEGVVEVESLGEVVDGLRKRGDDGDDDVAEMFLRGMKISHC